ncbi:hypothetical protein CCOS191_4014 [Pseudomonas sp. CCOS 191]|nr:hypothetical protein CCOS191_4014 [Pseudomonas sp. CCOS 191]
MTPWVHAAESRCQIARLIRNRPTIKMAIVFVAHVFGKPRQSALSNFFFEDKRIHALGNDNQSSHVANNLFSSLKEHQAQQDHHSLMTLM